MEKPAPRNNATVASPVYDPQLLHPLLQDLGAIRARMLALELERDDQLCTIHPSYRASARNLIHYLALRQHDIRRLQEQLAALGLSSLGRSEAHVLCSLDAVLAALHHFAGLPVQPSEPARPGLSFAEGKARLDAHTEALLGPEPASRNARVMVTLPSEAASDYPLVRDLLQRGMEIARVNCAHDDPVAWAGMIDNLRRGEAELDKRCCIVMDIPGPKLRTGPLELGPQVLVWRPQRDRCGRVTEPAHIWITPEDDPTPTPDRATACLALPAAWVAQLKVGDTVKLRDLRGKKRRLTITECVGTSRWADTDTTAYIGPETVLVSTGRKKRGRKARDLARTTAGPVPPKPGVIVLHVGDTLVLTRELVPGRPAEYGPGDILLQPARLGCTFPEVFQHVRVGERILFDDGKIAGVITAVSEPELHVRITSTRPRGGKLRADKGINLPESILHLPALTEDDLTILPFIAEHADTAQLSFAQDPEGVEQLQAYLAAHSQRPVGIILKIETRLGFEQLPKLLLTAMQSYPVGVMIARGDLAVECGYERMAEVQEEILWLCEAAHIPVIWATQVLESLAHTGIPSRAEVTDAAMGQRAECVMLNKGPHIVETVSVLDDILRRMQEHQQKKSARLRKLRISAMYAEKPEAGGETAPAGVVAPEEARDV